MTDEEFVESVRAGTVPAFRHADHLRLTWALLQTHDAGKALDEVREIIRGFAARHGKAAKYHETITRFWVEIVAHARARHTGAASCDDLLVLAPHLLDKQLPWRHWSDTLLMSERARQDWVMPDIAPLPWAARA